MVPVDRGFNDAQIFVQCFHRRTSIDAARRPLLKLLPEPLPMCAEILECVTVFEAQIPSTINSIACDIIKSADQNTRRPK
jgi:hypothetical protein